MVDHNNNPPGTGDELDSLLRRWHDVNAERAAAGRDRLIAAMRDERRTRRRAPSSPGLTVSAILGIVRRTLVNRYSPAVASLMFLVVIAALLMPSPRGQAFAREIMVPDGGRLEALDEEGNLLGPCPLKHTDVDAFVSGFFSRVNVTQTYHNPYAKKIEAVYTFPLSHRAAVDRMTMTVGDRVVEGEVKERQLARQIYEAAKKQNYVASLLEQERPNIFTQSVANIEPEAEVVVKLSYVEVLQSADGTYTFDFPMVVGPRYIPGAPTASQAMVPAELKPRQGVILLGPANLTVGDAGDPSTLGSLQGGKLDALLSAAQPIMYPGDTWWGKGDPTGGAGQAQLWYRFEAAYCDGSKEMGELYTDGTGQLQGRWFYTDPKAIQGMGTGFEQDTNQVPDASRITPQPVRPGTRAGHDVSLRVTIDTGGPGLLDVKSALHEIKRSDELNRDDGLPRQVTLALADKDEIPNRDFALSWRQTADTIQEAVLMHTATDLGDWSGGFFTLILQPPARVEDAAIPPRELVFVMDTSGSMQGFPIEKSKEVMTRAIDSMRAEDTFNVITFAGSTAVLWQKPRPATPENRAGARSFVEGQRGGGGTEMMQAIDAALVQAPSGGPGVLSPRQLLDLPADGRAVEVEAAYSDIRVTPKAGLFTILLGDDLDVWLRLPGDLPTVLQPAGVTLRLRGRWITEGGRRVLVADKVSPAGHGSAAGPPMRIALFFTDGYVGNDMAIIDAVRRNAGTTRVFSFGIGNSVNRWLLESMAGAGRGEVEFVLLASDADEAVNRLSKRIETPVLTDISLAFSDRLDVVDMIPAPGAIPDLFDVKPLVIHGRYKNPGKGTVTVSGRTGAGAWQRSVDLDLPQSAPQHDVIATLWARARTDEVLAPHLQSVQQGAAPQPVQDQVVALGETFSIMSQFTSFVAVEKSRMTIGGQPVLVAVPIEMPEGVSYEGVFGEPQLQEGLALDNFGVANGDGNWRHVTNLERKAGKRAAPGKGGYGGGGVEEAGKTSAGQRLKGTTGPMPGSAPLAGVSLRKAGQLDSGMVREDPGPARPAIPPAAAPAEPSVGLERLRRGLQGFDFAAPDASRENAESPTRDETMTFPWQEARDMAFYQVDIPGEFLKETEGERPSAGDRPVLVQDAALGIADRVEKNEVTDAARLAERLAAVRPDYQVATKMHAAFTDGSLDEAGRKVIDEQAEVARRQLADIERQMRLHRVLDSALLAMVQAPKDQKRLDDQEADLGSGLNQDKARADLGPAPVLVTVLVTDVQKTRKALEEAGLEIVDASKSLPIIVGRAELSKLEALALVEGVRRIEPTKMAPGS